jgi:hypothetical protein
MIHTWSISQMDCSADGIVRSVAWNLTSTDGTYSGYTAGAVDIVPDPSVAPTPYAALVEAQVIAWAEAVIGADEIAAAQANNAQQIADQIAPPILTPDLPWQT